MKSIALVFMTIYLSATLLAAIYSFVKTKQLSKRRFLLVCLMEGILLATLVAYTWFYQPIQFLFFALSFTAISSLFFFTKTEGKGELVLIFHFIRFLIHVQLMVLLYLFRNG